jgi:hypothetical protein
MIFPIMAPPDPWGLWFEQNWISTISGSCCVNLSFLALWFLSRRFLNYHPPYFCIFVINSISKRTWRLTYTILNSLYLRVICKKVWNWLAGSEEEDFFQYKHMYKCFSHSTLWPHPTPGDNDLYKVDFPLY